MRAEWNSALFACVVAAYAALLLALPRHVGLPSEPQHLPSSRLPSPASRPLALAKAQAEGQAEAVTPAQAEAEKQAEAEAEAEAGGQGAAPPSMYAWWPTSAPLAHEELGRLPLTLTLPLTLALLLPLP